MTTRIWRCSQAIYS